MSGALGLESPLTECLGNYRDFFALLECFRGYVEHFLCRTWSMTRSLPSGSSTCAVTCLKTRCPYLGPMIIAST